VRVGFAQINPTVGDLGGNTAKILNAYKSLCADGAELVLTPELAICGYPPQDLVFKSRFVPLNLERLAELHSAIGDVPLLVGYVENNEGAGQPFRNAAALLQRGQPVQRVFKSLLPTYDVFDEDRYFEPAASTEVLLIGGRKIGVTICEDIWTGKYLPRRLYGFEPVQEGSFYVQAVTWHDKTKCPDARTILTYSLSTNPRSPFFSDQTAMFSRKKWVQEVFCAAAVRKHTVTTTTITSGAKTKTVRRGAARRRARR